MVPYMCGTTHPLLKEIGDSNVFGENIGVSLLNIHLIKIFNKK